MSFERTLRALFLLAAAAAGARAQQAPTVEVPTETVADRVQQRATAGAVLLTNATVITVSGPTLERASVLVVGGKIRAIERGRIDAPAGTTVIDCTGMYVTPGIIDCHSHIAEGAGTNEGTSSITAEVRIGDQIDGDDVSIYRALAGGCTAANLLHGSANAIGGQNAVIKMKYRRPGPELLVADAPRGIKFALGENPKRAGADGDEPQRYPATRMGVEAVIRRAFLEAKEYRARQQAFAAARARGEDPEPPRPDVRLETLAEVLEGKVWVHCHSYRADEILMLMRLAEEFGFRIRTFQHVLEGYKVAPELAKHGAGGSTFSDWWAYKAEAYDAIPYNAALMARAGVLVSLNSDSSELMRRLNLEAAKTVKYGGVGDVAALAMVTLNPAKQLGIDHRMGSIEVGKDGDIAVWNAHPLSAYSRCELTLVDGEILFERTGHPSALDVDLAATAGAAAEPSDAAPALAAGPVQRSAADRREGPGRFAIVNARIVPVSAPEIARGVIVVADGRIEAIGADVAVPANATVVDAAGLSVYPGMIDPSTFLGLTEIGSVPATIDSREQGSNQADLRVALAINPASEHVAVARCNGITTAVARPRGSLIAGQSALIHLDGWTWEQMTLVDPLALHVQTPGWGGRRGRGGRGPAGPEADGAADDRRTKELLDAFSAAREYGRTRGEAAANGAALAAADPRMEALLPYARGERPVVFDADDEKAIEQAVSLARRAGVRPIINGGREAWKVARLLAENDVPVLLGPVLANPTEPHDPYDAPFAGAAVLHRAGVRFAFTTADSSNVRNLPYHAAMAAAFGLPKDAALKAVTLAAAEIFGVDRDLGSLAPGKLADLVLADGDLLEIRTEVRGLYIAGRRVPLESRHTRLYEEFSRRLDEEAARAR